MKPKRVVIVGAGIIGSAIAYRLARSGHDVTLLAAGHAGGVATPNSFAWINASWGNPLDYYRLRIRSMAEWRALAGEVPDLSYRACGGLIWDLPPPELEAFANEHEAWGYDIRRLDREGAKRTEPRLTIVPDFALHVASEGVVEPSIAVPGLLRAAQKLGMKIRADEMLKSFKLKGDKVTGVETQTGPIESDEVVIAAGAETPKLTAILGFRLPMNSPPGLLVHTKPHAHVLNGLVLAPTIHMRQSIEGRIIAGSDFAGTDPGEDATTTALELFAELCSMIHCDRPVEYDFHTVGYRPMPSDGFPAVGRVPGREGVYVAVMHSGITLAPAIGRIIAEEISTGRRDGLITPYGLERFSGDQ